MKNFKDKKKEMLTQVFVFSNEQSYIFIVRFLRWVSPVIDVVTKGIQIIGFFSFLFQTKMTKQSKAKEQMKMKMMK